MVKNNFRQVVNKKSTNLEEELQDSYNKPIVLCEESVKIDLEEAHLELRKDKPIVLCEIYINIKPAKKD